MTEAGPQRPASRYILWSHGKLSYTVGEPPRLEGTVAQFAAIRRGNGGMDYWMIEDLDQVPGNLISSPYEARFDGGTLLMLRADDEKGLLLAYGPGGWLEYESNLLSMTTAGR